MADEPTKTQDAVATFTDDNFDQEVKGAEGVVVVDFWAEWCAPCRMISPLVEKLAEKYASDNRVKVGKLDTDANSKTSMEYHIMSIPTVKYYVGGKLVDELNGFMGPATEDVLEEKLQGALGKVETTE